MTKARSEHISLDDTPFYHCMVRCVRRAYLCGDDVVTGANFDHRKQWLVSRLRFLSYVYAIDICAYAVMSNHYHVVLHVDQARAESWSDTEVAERWMQLYKGQLLVSQWLKSPSGLSVAELATVAEIIAVWRERLASISWFMRGVNETIARMANEEDGCKGRFWEGRFKSQALLDEAALLSCMAYVDLNPVRAAIAEDVIDSDFTGVQQRLMDYAEQAEAALDASAKNTLVQKQRKQTDMKRNLAIEDYPEAELMPFSGSSFTDITVALPFSFADYLALVDSTGRVVRPDKRGAIDPQAKKVVERVGLNPDDWLAHVSGFGKCFGQYAGRRDTLKGHARRCNKAWFKGCG